MHIINSRIQPVKRCFVMVDSYFNKNERQDSNSWMLYYGSSLPRSSRLEFNSEYLRKNIHAQWNPVIDYLVACTLFEDKQSARFHLLSIFLDERNISEVNQTVFSTFNEKKGYIERKGYIRTASGNKFFTERLVLVEFNIHPETNKPFPFTTPLSVEVK